MWSGGEIAALTDRVGRTRLPNAEGQLRQATHEMPQTIVEVQADATKARSLPSVAFLIAASDTKADTSLGSSHAGSERERNLGTGNSDW